MNEHAGGLLRHAGHWGWLAGAQLTRLPIAMAPLALTSLTAALMDSYGTGAAMVAAIIIAEVACAIPMGRLLDRIGVTRGTRVLLLARGLMYAPAPGRAARCR